MSKNHQALRLAPRGAVRVSPCGSHSCFRITRSSVIRGCSCHIRRTERQWIKMQTDHGHHRQAADLPKVIRRNDRFSWGNHEPRRRKTTHALCAGSLRRMGTYAHADGERERTPAHAHTRTNARTNARAHARQRGRTRKRAHTHTHAPRARAHPRTRPHTQGPPRPHTRETGNWRHFSARSKCDAIAFSLTFVGASGMQSVASLDLTHVHAREAEE